MRCDCEGWVSFSHWWERNVQARPEKDVWTHCPYCGKKLSKELKPCPFCGNHMIAKAGEGHTMYCRCCNSQGPFRPGSPEDAWNNRTGDK
jgi:hypothetical protein